MKTSKKTAAPKLVASISIYGSRDAGFAYLAHGATDATRTGIFGDYVPLGKMPHEDATTALFAACDALRDRGVVGLARVSFDRKLSDGRTVVRYGDVSISTPPWFGNVSWTEEVVG